MKLGIYSMRDAQSGFLAPTLDTNDDTARRNFAHSVMMTNDSLFFTHAADFSLHKIGEFETATGLITPIIPPIHIAYATDFKKGDKNGKDECNSISD